MFSSLGGTIKDKIFSIVLILIIIVVLYFGTKKIITLIKGAQLSEKSELQQLINSGQTLSYTESQYKTYANKLYVAMKGLGTDTTAIYAVFNAMRNTADVMKLVTAFGVRDEEDLSEWMAGEKFLDIEIINKTLRAKGIEYQF